jgi:predicted dehydrogenase/uncharacterized protein (DUF362 family)
LVFKVGIVGAGRVVEQYHLPNLAKVSKLKVVAVSDLSPERAARIADKARAEKSFTDYKQMLNEDLDIAMICTPPYSHHEIALEAASRGINVFVEKPFSLNYESARELLKYADQVHIQPGHNFIFSSGVQLLRHLVQTREIEEHIGKIKMASLEFVVPHQFWKNVTKYQLSDPFGLAIDTGSNLLYLTDFLFGGAERYLHVTAVPGAFSTFSSVTAYLDTESGHRVKIRMSNVGFIPKLGIEVIGDSGRIQYTPLRQRTLRVITSGGKKSLGTTNLGKDYLLSSLEALHGIGVREEHEHFVRVLEGAEPIVGLEDGLENTRQLLALIAELKPYSSGIFSFKQASYPSVSIRRVEADWRLIERKLLEIIDGRATLKHYISGRKVYLKPNLCDRREMGFSVNTHPEVLRGVAEVLRRFTDDLTIVESDSGGGTLEEKLGGLKEVSRVCSELRIPIVNLSRVETTEVREGGLRLRLPSILLDPSASIVDLAKMKTHGNVKISCALKNMFGLISTKRKSIYHRRLDRTISLVNRVIRSGLVIVDGIVCMEGNGPLVGMPRRLNIIMVGDDPVSIDAVCCYMMGVDPYEVEHLRLTEEAGIGEIDLRRINIDSDGKYFFNFIRPFTPRALLGTIKSIPRVYLS